MTADWPAYLQLAISAVLVLVVLWLALDLRRGRAASVDVGRILREEETRGREEAATAARLLREEIDGNLSRLSERMVQTLDQLSRTQQERLERVEKQVAALVETSERKQEQLRVAIEQRLTEMKTDASVSARNMREEVTGTLAKLGSDLRATVSDMAGSQNQRLEAIKTEINEVTAANERRGEVLRQTVEQRLEVLRTDSAAKLEQMRQTVDEKLQGTLEKRLGESFGLVSKQLEQVHRSVGEMQTLATGVGDLKRVLTNVKSRGTWGEVQLGTLLDQIMTPDQVARNVEVVPGSGQRVEFAIRLPGREDDSEVLLPIDAKFPHEDYDRLVDAAERGDKEAEEAALKAIETRVKGEARTICDKYVHPPHTTDFGILFLPTEGLYAEVLRRPGLASALQTDCKVTIAGPTTLHALLTSLQMGFRSLAIEKRSSEVWQVLGAVKTEFSKYGDVLDKVQKKLREADKEIDRVGVRKRAIDRRLRTVESLPESETGELLRIAELAAPDEESEEALAGG